MRDLRAAKGRKGKRGEREGTDPATSTREAVVGKAKDLLDHAVFSSLAVQATFIRQAIAR